MEKEANKAKKLLKYKGKINSYNLFKCSFGEEVRNTKNIWKK